MKTSKKNLFRPKSTYAALGSKRADESKPARNESATDSEHLGQMRDWIVRTFFEQLFAIASDEIQLRDSTETFDILASELEALPASAKAEILAQMSYYVGRVRVNLDAVEQRWHSAISRASLSATKE